mmetsp:Transcript_74491/g.223944  ORF Transcript_74491/g.223944 Transcript_74491/m.223944 type:complete len:216 (+) Transcript_74491:1770-2417(+)
MLSALVRRLLRSLDNSAASSAETSDCPSSDVSESERPWDIVSVSRQLSLITSSSSSPSRSAAEMRSHFAAEIRFGTAGSSKPSELRAFGSGSSTLLPCLLRLERLIRPRKLIRPLFHFFAVSWRFTLGNFTLPLIKIRPSRSRGERVEEPVVVSTSKNVKIRSPKCSEHRLATARCCLGRQCISNDRTTGRFDVVKAHSATAFATASNVSMVTNV